MKNSKTQMLILLFRNVLKISNFENGTKTSKNEQKLTIVGTEKRNLKKSLIGGPVIDCFEPVFGFLMQFWFQKHRSDTWDPKGMFSALSGRSESILYQIICQRR